MVRPSAIRYTPKYKPIISGLHYPEMRARRAEVHLDELDVEMQKFVDSHPYEVTRKDNVKKFWHIIRIGPKPCSDKIPLLVGEFAYSLRSCLDNLAWQLALLTTERPKSHTAFPIRAIRPEKGWGDVLKDVLPAAIPVIESLQPYQRGNAYKDDPLWILNELCVIDKHAVPAVSCSQFGFRINGGVPILFVTERDYTTEVTISLSDKYKAQFDPDPIEIIFGRPIYASGESFEVRFKVLRPIHKFVRDDVLPRFAGFFKK